MASIYKGDTGTIIELSIRDENNNAVNVSGATVKQFKFRSPSGVSSTKTAAFSTDGNDGKLRYTTLTGDMNESGDWTAQAYVEIGESIKFHSSPVTIPVRPVS